MYAENTTYAPPMIRTHETSAPLMNSSISFAEAAPPTAAIVYAQ